MRLRQHLKPVLCTHFDMNRSVLYDFQGQEVTGDRTVRVCHALANYKNISDKFDRGLVAEYDKIRTNVQVRNIIEDRKSVV